MAAAWCAVALTVATGASATALEAHPGGPATSAPAIFTSEDMLALVRFSGPVAVAPAGDRVAYVLPDPGNEWNVLERRPLGWLYVQSVNGEHDRVQLTHGTSYSSLPAWSPDGRRLAFFISEGEGARLAVWDRVSGRVDRHGARFTGSATQPPQWAGNERLVYATPVAPPPQPPRARVEVVHSSDRRIPGDAYFTRTTESGLTVVDLVTAEATPILGARVLRRFSVAPGGRYLTFVEPTEATVGIVGGEINETFLLATTGGSPHRIGDAGQRFAWSPEGTHLISRERNGSVAFEVLHSVPGAAASAAGRPAILGPPQPYLNNIDIPTGGAVSAPDASRFVSLVPDRSITDPEIEPPQRGMYTIARPFMDLYLVTVDSGRAVNLTAGFPDNVSSPSWSPDGGAIVFRAVDNRTYDETIYRYTLADHALVAIAHGRESYADLVATSDGAIATIQSATAPPDLWRIDADGIRHRLTDLNPQLAAFTFSAPEMFHFDSATGDRLGALLYRPATPGDTAAPGLITYIYEKLTPAIHRFSARNQMFASHGYALLMPNVKIRVGETGTSYVDSVVPAVQAVRAMGVTNGKACLWGGSFGAYGTSFVITQTDIFDCAVSRATPPELFRNWASGRDRDSVNIERGQARMGGSPFQYMERYIAQSAFFHLDQVETPVLIMHGVKDYTILFGEGEMFFYALRRLGKEAEFVIYTQGDHSLSRHSRADTLDVQNRMLEWFGRYLR